ncbi:MAG: STAS domain-containing protein [Planctomycetota bacterium]
MRIARRTAGNVTILALAGEFDDDGVRALGEKTDAVVEKGCHRLVFSLGNVRFFNSTVFGNLVTASRHLKDVNAELVVSAPSDVVQRMLDTLGLARQLRVFPDDRAALAYFREGDDLTDDTVSECDTVSE